MKKIYCLLLALFLCFFSSYAQSKEDKQLEKKLDELLSGQFKATEPGCAVLVAKKGKIIYQKSFGVANMELLTPIQPDMVFRLASITKQFTAVAILQLAEQGKLSLQDSVQKFVKDFPSKGHTITIENLLTHTSGIKDYLQIEYPDPYAERKDYVPQQIMDIFKNIPLEFEPGTAFRYSNSGYFLLGLIIEKVSGKEYKTYVTENLLQPLSLSRTRFDSFSSIIPGRVAGYKKDGMEYKNADFWSMTIPYSAGALMSNVDDLFKWHTGLYSYKILKKETLEKAFLPFTLKNGTLSEYGYGWFLKSVGGTRSISHGGLITGFKTDEIYFPAEDLFIATLYNCDCAPRDELSVKISSLALNKPLQPSVKVEEDILNSYLGTYTLETDPKRTITLSKEGGFVVASISGQDPLLLVFQSATKFQFMNLIGAEGEFIKENGKVVQFNITQGGLYVWKKTN